MFLLSSTLVTGGAEGVVRSLALGLPEHGFLPHIICIHDLGRVGRELAKRGVTAHFGLSSGSFDPSVFFRLYRIFRREWEAILFSMDHHNALFWGALASVPAGIKHRIMPLHSTGLFSKGRSFSLTDRMVLPLYDRVIALAESHADYIERHEGIDRGKIVVINNGIDTGRFKPPVSDEERFEARKALSVDDDSFVVTIVAALRPEKNHEMFLRAAAGIRSKNGKFTFLIVGDGKEAGKLQSLAKELSLGESVRFMGIRDDIPGILSISDAFVLCSYPVVETFPLSVLEAMACGVPVVSTSVGSIGEMIRDGKEGFLIQPGDVDALVAKVLELEGDPAKRAAMGESARKRVVEEFSEERMVAGYARLFRNLLENGKKG